MSKADVFLWVALPYLAIAIFVVGHVWRFRRDQLAWTARSTQLLERRWLRAGSLLFHLGILAAVGGHVLGILIPKGWMDWIGIHEHAYHWLSVIAGGLAGLAVVAGFAILGVRRLRFPRVRATTTRSDHLLYPLLGLVIVSGMIATIWGNALDEYPYRLTVAPWFRGLFQFDPQPELMADAPFVFQLHAVSAWVLFAAWPFTRLVHAWSVPLGYLTRRGHVLYRSRTPQAALAAERSRQRAERATGARERTRA